MNAELRAELDRSCRHLFEAISSLSEEQFRARPEPDSWCISEVLAHLLLTEQRHHELMRLALERRGAEVAASSDEQRRAAVAFGREAPVPQLVHGLLAARRSILLLLEELGEADLAASVRHPREGELSVRDLLHRLVRHEQEHRRQIEETRDGLVAARVRHL